MTSVAWRLTCFAIGAALVGCSSDHDLLAQRPGPGSDGAIGDGPAQDGFPVGPRDGAPAVDAGDPEPPGPWLLTLMNGVVDVDTARFCFVPIVDGGDVPPDEMPLPDQALSFGAHVVLSTLAPIDLATTDVHPYLVVRADSGASCREILEAQVAEGGPLPPRIHLVAPFAWSLPIIPAGTLAESRSYFAIANGCTEPFAEPGRAAADGGDGGDASDGASMAAAICGTGFGSTTLGLSLVKLSRQEDFVKVGFQAVNGSNAAAPATILVENPLSNATVFLGDSLALGQITPRARPAYVARGEFGFPLGSASVRVNPVPGNVSFPEFDTTMATVLSASGLDEGVFDGAANFTFVMLGIVPGQDAATSGNPFRVELVENAPDLAADGR